MSLIFFLLQQSDTVDTIKEKIRNAPDKSYEIGVLIGTYLPYVIMVAIAYVIYYQMKKYKDREL
ncbi:MAG: hypothetical protein KDC69_04475 [Flavobacteriaceae bacterium]|nr:hypothetical protein [Flavobacteriaceae bacterium]